MSDKYDAFGAALGDLRFREDLGFGAFNTVSPGRRRLRYPDFMIIGAQKAGTTWLHDNINFHPNIWLAPAKELNYFNQLYAPSPDEWEEAGRLSQAAAAREFLENANSLSARQKCKLAALDVIEERAVSDDWYGRIFSHAPAEDLCGESSPDYCVLPRGGIAHIASLNAKIKVILLLRDPIDRFWSHVRMATQHNYAEPSLAFLEDDYVWRNFAGRSNYPEILRRWRSILGRDQVIVLNGDLVAHDPFGLLRSVAGALGVGFNADFFPNARKAIGAGESALMQEDLYEVAKKRMRFIYDELMEVEPQFAAPWYERHYGGSAAEGEATPQQSWDDTDVEARLNCGDTHHLDSEPD